MDGWMRCVCVDMGLYDTRIDTSSVPCPPAKVGGYSLCNHWAQVPLGTLSFQFKALFLCSPFFQTHPQFPGLRSEKKIWLEKLPSFQNSLGNRNCINSDTHTDIENTTWTSECVCVYVCTVAIAKRVHIPFHTKIQCDKKLFCAGNRIFSNLITTLWWDNQEMGSPFSSHHSKLHWVNTRPDGWSVRMCMLTVSHSANR